VTESDEIEAIKRLKARYFRTLDTKDWGGLLNLFVPDVEIDVTADGGSATEGAAEFVSTLEQLLADVITVHHGHMPEIELTSATTATGIWAMEDHLWWPEGSPIRHLHGYGHYHETYTRMPEGWRIGSLRLTRLHREFRLPE